MGHLMLFVLLKCAVEGVLVKVKVMVVVARPMR